MKYTGWCTNDFTAHGYLKAFSLLPRADPIVSVVMASGRPQCGAGLARERRGERGEVAGDRYCFIENPYPKHSPVSYNSTDHQLPRLYATLLRLGRPTVVVDSRCGGAQIERVWVSGVPRVVGGEPTDPGLLDRAAALLEVRGAWPPPARGCVRRRA